MKMTMQPKGGDRTPEEPTETDRAEAPQARRFVTPPGWKDTTSEMSGTTLTIIGGFPPTRNPPVDLSRYSAEEREIIAICQRGHDDPMTEAQIKTCLGRGRRSANSLVTEGFAGEAYA
jgi:hypothetical protein